MRGHAGAVSYLQELLESPDPVGISAITVMQLYHGVSRSSVPEAEAVAEKGPWADGPRKG